MASRHGEFGVVSLHKEGAILLLAAATRQLADLHTAPVLRSLRRTVAHTAVHARAVYRCRCPRALSCTATGCWRSHLSHSQAGRSTWRRACRARDVLGPCARTSSSRGARRAATAADVSVVGDNIKHRPLELTVTEKLGRIAAVWRAISPVVLAAAGNPGPRLGARLRVGLGLPPWRRLAAPASPPAGKAPKPP
eukprot:gnl/Chilomastix_cuspidata/6718.p2 GENE.gnl/Chilomastix_cuspidata/6718~~gnl/Chilomastix_cuspidata/6718.p2  ORF type:complete len:194 (-),score=48.44 gnl/Chilomastix_cuspidata/6718:169-750(-)